MALPWWRRQRGNEAEREAAHWLTRQGLLLVAQNWHCRLGEIDLIMQHGDTLVFVEVRYRQHHGYGGALGSVDQHKQRRLVAAARHFLARHPRWADSFCRFDVIALDGQQCAPNWIQNAFYGDE